MFRMAHQNFNVLDLNQSLTFYQTALGLHEVRRKETPDFTLVYLADDSETFQLELTWLKDRVTPYNLGDEEFHLAFATDDLQAAHDLHAKMGIYFIKDPDGYWLEIVPQR